ncbi:MAG TPA: radical SAM protein [Kiritimatiellia bacterium]|nr:radical SAM protein [Kiritimatiellia bacterium]HPS05995.1 radical SAM protein [Kiritimatiellia bacterium]
MNNHHAQHVSLVSGFAESCGPRVVAWEITRRCPLACRHCRAGAKDCAYQGELSTDDCLRVLDSLAAFSRPMIIWTGGEPMYRPDILGLVRGATSRGLRSVMAPCGTLVTREALLALKDAGVAACSFSLDGSNAASHDAFRGVAGAFENVMRAMVVASEIGMPFQVNTTVSRLNKDELAAIREVAITHGARTLDLFFLVPVGRGAEMRDLSLPPRDAEAVLRWAFDMDRKGPIHVRETCAPQAVRVWHALGRPGREPAGCMGGRGFAFISHTGVLQPCGFLNVPSGDLRACGFDFRMAYENSAVFNNLKRPDQYGGACGTCAFRFDCGGCRARAYAVTGDYMAAETSCPMADEKGMQTK